MSEKLFRPDSGVIPDTLVVSYYPLAGNDRNTGDPRYQREADLTGFDVLGITRIGSNTTQFHPSLRKKLSVENFEEFWQEQAANLDVMTADYDNVIVRGQSTGSFPALHVVKTGMVKATHFIAEDGVNTRLNWRGRQRLPITAKYDWAKGLLDETRAKPQPLDPEWEKPQGAPAPEGTTKFLEGPRSLLSEIYHWAPLWRSPYSREAALEIAETRPELPMLFVFLGHTATSTPEEAKRFIGTLEDINEQRQELPQPTAEIASKFDADAWHNILEYPDFGARNLKMVATMRSYVKPEAA